METGRPTEATKIATSPSVGLVAAVIHVPSVVAPPPDDPLGMSVFLLHKLCTNALAGEGLLSGSGICCGPFWQSAYVFESRHVWPACEALRRVCETLMVTQKGMIQVGAMARYDRDEQCWRRVHGAPLTDDGIRLLDLDTLTARVEQWVANTSWAWTDYLASISK